MNAALRQDEPVIKGGKSGLQRSAPPAEGGDAVGKIPFVASGGQYTELPGGISLYVGSVDVRRGHLSGWMWLAEDHRHVWLSNHHVDQPISVRGSYDGLMTQLVITALSAGSASGYLLTRKPDSQMH